MPAPVYYVRKQKGSQGIPSAGLELGMTTSVKAQDERFCGQNRLETRWSVVVAGLHKQEGPSPSFPCEPLPASSAATASAPKKRALATHDGKSGSLSPPIPRAPTGRFTRSPAPEPIMGPNARLISHTRQKRAKACPRRDITEGFNSFFLLLVGGPCRFDLRFGFSVCFNGPLGPVLHSEDQ